MPPTARELTIKDKLKAQAELASTSAERDDLKKQVDVRIAQVLKVCGWVEAQGPSAVHDRGVAALMSSMGLPISQAHTAFFCTTQQH